MRQILIAVGIALTISILLTPVLIRLFTRQGFGHEIREDGPPSHHKKRGTPSMGGVAILAGIWAGYLGTQLIGIVMDGRGPSASGWLVLGLATALGAVGFVDDLIKIRESRNLGLNKTAKTLGILAAAVIFGILALQFHNADGLTPGSAELSYVR
jgi:phospho-N-acetylmuramoyl-pentapeptide-transferase